MNFIRIYILILLLNVVHGQLKNNPTKQLPENEIFGAEISIIDDNKLSAVITCDTLISKNSNSAILKGNVVAKFYDSEIFNDTNGNGLKDEGEWYDDENQNERFDNSFIISQLKSNIAYSEKSSLIAKKNVSVVKFDIIDKTKAIEAYKKLLVDYPGSLFSDEARKRYRVLRGDKIVDDSNPEYRKWNN